jgi:hypothetical protein
VSFAQTLYFKREEVMSLTFPELVKHRVIL